MINTIYDLFWLFSIYAFLGWCIEVSYATLKSGKFINRGFFNGPVCPIYGFGIVIVVICLAPMKENIIILFFGSVILTSILEFITGFILEKIFHNHWWDYSENLLNIRGYVCLKFSIIWGIACVIIMEMIHPVIKYFINIIPYKLGLIIIIILLTLLVIDGFITIKAILTLNQKLYLMYEITKKLKLFYQDIGLNISNGVADIIEIGDDWKYNIENIKNNLDDRKKEFYLLKESYIKLHEEKYLIHRRLMKAFPSMKSKKYQEVLESLKLHYKNKRYK